MQPFEKLGIRNLSSVDCSDSKVAFLMEGEDAVFCLFKKKINFFYRELIATELTLQQLIFY